MKKNLLVLCLSLIAHFACAQTDVPEPFKGANTILIHTSDSANVALKNIGRTMVLQGCTVQKLDSEMGYVTAGIKSGSYSKPSVFGFKAVVIPEKGGTAIQITGECASINTFKLQQSISYDKGNVIAREGFIKAQKIAISYPSGRIGYSIQE